MRKARRQPRVTPTPPPTPTEQKNGHAPTALQPLSPKVAALADVSPPVPAWQALRDNALYQAFKVTDQRMDKIMNALAEKAEAGDLKATELLLDFTKAGMAAQASSRDRPTVNMQQAILHPGGGQRPFLSDIRRNIALILAAEGPLQTHAIAERLRMLLPDVLVAMHGEDGEPHPYFAKQEDRWHLTTRSRAEVIGE
jgi:hypothetical protein